MKKNERPDHIGAHGPGVTKSPALEKLTRAERRRAAAQNRANGQPEITKQGTRHLTGTCAGCVFWDTADPEVRTGMGVCRGGIPQLVTVATPNGNALQALWPVSAFNATCGAHMTPTEYAAKKEMAV